MKKTFLSSILISLFLLTACSTNTYRSHTDAAALANKTLGKSTSAEAAEEAEEPAEPVVDLMLRYQSLPLPNGMGVAQGQCYQHGRVYSYGNDRGPAVGFTALDGTTGMLTLPAEDAYVHAICAADDRLAVLAGSFPMLYTDAEGESQGSPVFDGAYEILLYNVEGTLTERIELQNLYKEQTDDFCDMAYLDGSYYLLAPHRVTRIGVDGAELARTPLDTEQHYHSVTACGGKLLLCIGDVMVQNEIRQLNAQTLEGNASFSLDGATLTGLGADADGRLLVCDEKNTVRRVDWDAQTGEKVFSWSENAQTSVQNYQRFYQLGDAWLALESPASGVSLYRVYDGAPSEKIKLTLTEVGWFRGLNHLVDDFNRSNEQYEIELIPASNDGDADKLRVLTELAIDPSDLYAGWLASDLPLNGQAFVDLRPWLEADSETCDALVPSLWGRLCKDGACYALPYEFSLRTWYGEAALFDHPGVSVEELETIVASSRYDYALDGSYCDSDQLTFLLLLRRNIMWTLTPASADLPILPLSVPWSCASRRAASHRNQASQMQQPLAFTSAPARCLCAASKVRRT